LIRVWTAGHFVSVRRSGAKLLSRSRAVAAVGAARRRGESVVFTNGCFDLLHVGHVRCLEAARRLGDRLVVGLNGDASVRRLKGADRPIVPARQRAEVVAALGCVDWVVIFPADTPLGLIRALRPDVLVKGGDWARDSIVGRKEVESWGGRVARIREVPSAATTRIVETIRAGHSAESLSTGRRWRTSRKPSKR
jgi:D-beta-D-heptose 7-phosphate kinase/D-beta-D-heptose 1-phosphate adenosyltransferase